MRSTHVLGLVAAFVTTLAVPLPDALAQDKKRDIAAIENDLVADTPAVRASAAAELADRFPEGAVAVPMLVDLLEDESPEVVAAAAKSIDGLVVAGTAPLLDFVSDDANWQTGTRLRDEVRRLVGAGMGSLVGKIDLVFDEDRVRQGKLPTAGELALVALGSSFADPWLVDAAQRGDGATRLLAASALAMDGAASIEPSVARAPMDPKPQDLAGALALVGDTDAAKSWTGIHVLERLRGSDIKSVSALTEVLREPAPGFGTFEWCRRRTAVVALARIGRPATASVPVLLDCIARERPETMVKAAEEDDDEDLPPPPRTRWPLPYAEALISMGQEALVEKLIAECKSCAEILDNGLDAGRRSPAKVVSLAIADLEASPEPNRAALSLLSRYRTAASAALPLLTKRLRAAQDRETAYAYAEAVLSISPSDPAGLEALDAQIEFSEHPYYLILGLHITVTPRTMARLQETLARANSSGDVAAENPLVLWALKPSGSAAKGAVGDLLRLLKGQEQRYIDVIARPQAAFGRANLVGALGAIGPDAAAAIPALTALRDKGDETIRVAAAQALRRIRAK